MNVACRGGKATDLTHAAGTEPARSVKKVSIAAALPPTQNMMEGASKAKTEVAGGGQVKNGIGHSSINTRTHVVGGSLG